MVMLNRLINLFSTSIRSIFTLLYLKILREYSRPESKITTKSFNNDWFISTGGTMISLAFNVLFAPDIIPHFTNLYEEKKSKEVIAVAFSVFFVTTIKFIYMRIFFKKDIINPKYIQVSIISILTVSFYILVFQPLFPDTLFSRYVNNIFKEVVLILSSDFIQDSDIDTHLYDINLSLIGTFLRSIINIFI